MKKKMARNILSGGHLDLSVSKQIPIIAQDDVSDPNKFVCTFGMANVIFLSIRSSQCLQFGLLC